MPVRIYDIAKKLGIESKEVLTKAKELGITSARVPSSSLDKITAEFLESHLAALHPPPSPPPVAPEPIRLVHPEPAPPPPVEVKSEPPHIAPPPAEEPQVAIPAAELPTAPAAPIEPARVYAGEQRG